jgi:hypothetical protein
MRLSLSYHLFEVAASRPACSFGRPLQHPVDAVRFLTSSVLIRRSFEQLGSPAGFRRLLALAFGEILSSPGIYRSGGSLVKKSGE